MTSRVVVLLFLLAVSTCRAQTEFYVSPDGSDSNEGTISSPFQTLHRAAAAVQTVNQAMTSDIHVFLRGGTHVFSNTLGLSIADSGFNGHNVIYEAYQDELAEISGGLNITGWKLYNKTSNIWVADASAFTSTRQLYVDGQRAERAGIRRGLLGAVNITDYGYITDSVDLVDIAAPSVLEFVYTSSGSSWTEARCGVDNITALPNNAGTNITMKQPCFTLGRGRVGDQGFNVPTAIENAFEFLMEPGQWFHDEKNHLLFYIPVTESMDEHVVTVPILEELMVIAGDTDSVLNRTHNIQFKNLHFQHASWLLPSSGYGYVDVQAGVCIYSPDLQVPTPGNIRVMAATDIVFDGCTFMHMGATALTITNSSQFTTVKNCLFTDISAAAIQVGVVNDAKETRPEYWHTNHQVINNVFFDLPKEYHGNAVIFAGYLVETLIAHNEVSDASYSAISLGWGWSRDPSYANNNRVIGNRLFNYMQGLVDGGGIYTLGPQLNSEVAFNFLFKQRHLYGSLYHDEGSAYFHTHDNVVSTSPEWLHIWTSSIHDIVVENCYSDQTYMIEAGTNITLSDNTFVNATNPWPEAAWDIMAQSGVPAEMHRRKFMRPINSNCQVPRRERPSIGIAAFEEWSLEKASGFASFDRSGQRVQASTLPAADRVEWQYSFPSFCFVE